jgi:hypothetical protein
VGRACERERARAGVAQLWGLMFAQLCRLASAAANQRCATMRTVPIVAGVHMVSPLLLLSLLSLLFLLQLLLYLRLLQFLRLLQLL